MSAAYLHYDLETINGAINLLRSAPQPRTIADIHYMMQPMARTLLGRYHRSMDILLWFVHISPFVVIRMSVDEYIKQLFLLSDAVNKLIDLELVQLDIKHLPNAYTPLYRHGKIADLVATLSPDEVAELASMLLQHSGNFSRYM